MFGATLGYPDKTALLLAAGCATWFFITSIISVVGIDRYFGRRTLTMFGATGMCTCMVILCIAAYINTPNAHNAMSAILYLYVAFFSIGWQGMSWLWSVELIPLSIRGPANALVSICPEFPWHRSDCSNCAYSRLPSTGSQTSALSLHARSCSSISLTGSMPYMQQCALSWSLPYTSSSLKLDRGASKRSTFYSRLPLHKETPGSLLLV
jgi:hypothetical protein